MSIELRYFLWLRVSLTLMSWTVMTQLWVSVSLSLWVRLRVSVSVWAMAILILNPAIFEVDAAYLSYKLQ